MKKFLKEKLNTEIEEFVSENGLIPSIAIVSLFIIGVFYLFTQ